MVTLDPVAGLLLGLGLAWLLAAAAIDKLRHRREFAALLAGYRILPAALLPLAGRLIPLGEAAIAVGLLLPPTRAGAALAAAGLLLVYALAMAINLARGRDDLDCGCSFGRAGQPLSAALLARNLVLAAGAALAALPVTPRALNWLDAGTVVFGLLSAAVCWLALHSLLHNAAVWREIGE